MFYKNLHVQSVIPEGWLKCYNNTSKVPAISQQYMWWVFLIYQEKEIVECFLI